jgi:F-type H+-transporting ATPase subunit delta
MKNDALIRIYTRPLFDLAVETKSIESISEELETKRAAKLDLLKIPYDKPWSKYFGRFLELVLRKGRQEILPFAADAYTHYWDDYRSRIDVTVTSAVALSDAEKKAISGKLSERTGKNVILNCRIDEKVLGGIRLQIGHQLLDATIIGKLSALRESLIQA